MSKMKRIGFLLLSIALASCSFSGFSTSSDFKVSFGNDLFSKEFGGKGHFVSCGQVNDSPWHPIIELSSNTDSSWIRMELLPDTCEGVYSFSESASPGTDYFIAGELYYRDTSFYFSPQDITLGEVQFDVFPDAPYETVRGNFKIATHDASGNEVIIRGRFDFESSGDASYDCLR